MLPNLHYLLLLSLHRVYLITSNFFCQIFLWIIQKSWKFSSQNFLTAQDLTLSKSQINDEARKLWQNFDHGNLELYGSLLCLYVPIYCSCIHCLVYMPIQLVVFWIPITFYAHLLNYTNIRSIFCNRTYSKKFDVSSHVKFKTL